jgi:hypothetical protein
MTSPNSLVFPTPGGTIDTWGVVLNAMLTLLDNADHTTGKGVPIPSAALGINGDVSWASYALTAAKTVSFVAVAPTALTPYVNAFFVSSVDSNLWFRNAAGTNVQLTAGAQLNLSAVGGIGGDYAAVAALFSYDDATKRYLAQQQGAPRPWAGFATGDIDLYQKAASITNKVTLKSPAALAASYALTFPAALPAAASIAQISAAGAVTASNVITGNITLSGTGHVLRGSRTITAAVSSGGAINIAGGGVTTPSVGRAGVGCPAGSTNAFPLSLTTSEFRIMTIDSINVWIAVAGAAVTLTLMYADTGGTLQPLFSATTAATVAQYTAVPIVVGPTGSMLVAGESYYLYVQPAAGNTTCNVLSVDFITSVPT